MGSAVARGIWIQVPAANSAAAAAHDQAKRPIDRRRARWGIADTLANNVALGTNGFSTSNESSSRNWTSWLAQDGHVARCSLSIACCDAFSSSSSSALNSGSIS